MLPSAPTFHIVSRPMAENERTYQLEFEERPGYLFARVTSDHLTREDAHDYLREIAERSNAMDCKKVLIERDVPTILPASDLFFTTNEFVKMMQGARIAIVSPHVTNHQALEFVTMVGSNRGASFHLHRTLEEAEQWLLSGGGTSFAGQINFTDGGAGTKKTEE